MKDYKNEYTRKLADPQWQKKRLYILERDNWTCQFCFSDDKELHVHHKYYLSGKEAWEYPDDCYETLCYECHENETASLKQVIPDLIQNFKIAGFNSGDFNFLNRTVMSMPEIVATNFVVRSSILAILYKLVRIINYDSSATDDIQRAFARQLNDYDPNALRDYERYLLKDKVEM